MEPIHLTQPQLTTARWVADHSSDDAVTEVPVQVNSPDNGRSVVRLRFERSPIDNRWVLTTPVVVTDQNS